MKKYIAIVAIALAPSAAMAGQPNGNVCDGLSSIAGSIMKARQSGAGVVDVMDAVQSNPSHELLESMIIDAYSIPRFSSQKYRDDAVRDFSDQFFVTCVKALGHR